MANQVIALRAQKRLVDAMKLAAEKNEVDLNEEIRLTLILAYAPYIRLLEAQTKNASPANSIPQLEVV